MRKIITGPESIQGSPEWLEFRRDKIGASDSPIIMGVSPWQTLLQLWENKIYGTEQKKNKPMEYGSQMEQSAREWFNEKMGSNYQPTLMQSDIHDFMTASFDGFNGEFACEIKCPGATDHLSALTGIIPDKYIPQLQHQMFVGEFNFIYYVSFDGRDGVFIPVLRDDGYIMNRLIPAISAFKGSMIDLKPPPASKMDVVSINDSQASIVAKEYQAIQKHMANLEIQSNYLKKELLKYADHPRIDIDGLKITRCIRKGDIRYKEIPELQGIDLEQYRKENVTYYKFS